MAPAPLPPDEELRVRDLRRLSIPDTAEEERCDRVTHLAARVLGVPTVLVSLVDTDRQWCKSRLGFPERQTPRSVSFCAHAIPLVVPDARQDERFRDNHLVTGPLGICSMGVESVLGEGSTFWFTLPVGKP